MTRFPELEARLAAQERRARLRSLAPAKGIDFASNDYLGLAQSPILRKAAQQAIARGVPFGASGSRLLRGNHPEHEALEVEAARFFGSEAALFMGGGYQANQAILAALPRAGDLILHDALAHASHHDGIRLSRAEARAFAHNDIEDARQIARDWRHASGRGRIWLVAETIYSMDGDRAPLVDLATLAREIEAVLILDEAHATGLYGASGRGLAHDLTESHSDLPVITLHTCGKALGASGALITADQSVISALIAGARPFIYATAPAPLTAAIVRASLTALQTYPELIRAAQTRRDHANAEAERHGIPATGSQIIPIRIGDDGAALRLSAALAQRGFDIRAIRPPTVPRGTARLRAAITGNVSRDDISALFETIAELTEPACLP